MRQLYEVRIRDNGTKKSKFYNAKNPDDAAKRYKGPGSIMWVQRAKKEKMLGVGEFFTLGNVLLKEFAEQKPLERILHENKKERNRNHRYVSKLRKLASR